MKKSPTNNMIREPAVAGQFYPELPDALIREIDTFLEEALIVTPAGKLIGIIVPHAGYVFSGWVAAYAYKILEGKQFDTVILVGLCHRGLKGVSIYDRGGYETPLGVVEVDIKITRSIIECDPENFRSQPEAHELEHSLEVQIPFLQRTLKDFKIVPILIDEPKYSAELADAIIKSVKGISEKVLLVGNTDLTHYPAYEDARRVDQSSVEAMMTLIPAEMDKVNAHWMAKGIPNLHCTVCSEAAIKTVIHAANQLGANHAELLKSANSGDVPIGDKQQVVGYAAIAITKEDDEEIQSSIFKEIGSKDGTKEDDAVSLDKTAQKELLRIARETLTACVKGQDVGDIISNHKQLVQHMGAFVTLKEKGELRGCIGRFEPDAPVWEIVKDMTQSAALEDPRFTPVPVDILRDIKIEISVLTPRRRIQDSKEIQIGKHGLYIKKGWYAGTLLPQVAMEYHWDVKMFLQQTCLKSGLPPDAWKDEKTEIYTYSAIIFHEE